VAIAIVNGNENHIVRLREGCVCINKRDMGKKGQLIYSMLSVTLKYMFKI